MTGLATDAVFGYPQLLPIGHPAKTSAVTMDTFFPPTHFRVAGQVSAKENVLLGNVSAQLAQPDDPNGKEFKFVIERIGYPIVLLSM